MLSLYLPILWLYHGVPLSTYLYGHIMLCLYISLWLYYVVSLFTYLYGYTILSLYKFTFPYGYTMLSFYLPIFMAIHVFSPG